jgi:hypothetical protein
MQDDSIIANRYGLWPEHQFPRRESKESSYSSYRSGEQRNTEKERTNAAILELRPASAIRYDLSKKQLQRMKRAIKTGKETRFSEKTRRRIAIALRDRLAASCKTNG